MNIFSSLAEATKNANIIANLGVVREHHKGSIYIILQNDGLFRIAAISDLSLGESVVRIVDIKNF